MAIMLYYPGDPFDDDDDAIMLSLAGTKPACRRGKTIISILGEKYGREIQTQKIEKGKEMKQYLSISICKVLGEK